MMSSSIVNKAILSDFLNPIKSKKEGFNEIDKFLLDDQEEVKKVKKNQIMDSSLESEEIGDSISSMSNTKNKLQAQSIRKRQAIRFKEQNNQTSHNQMTNSGMKKTPTVVHTGNSEFREILGKFTEKNKELGPSKASQYYKLAFRQTKLFHFKEHSFTKKAYFFRSHPHVQEFMSIISWIYLLISFLEPGHSTDSSVEIDSFAFIFTTICECIILTIFAIDGCFKVFFTIVSTKQTYNSRFLCDSVFLVNTISVLCMIIDTMLFHIIYPSTYFRFSRILRPVKVAMESTEVSRTLRALSKTIPQIVDV